MREEEEGMVARLSRLAHAFSSVLDTEKTPTLQFKFLTPSYWGEDKHPQPVPPPAPTDNPPQSLR